MNPWMALAVFAALIAGTGLAMIGLSQWVGPRRTHSRSGAPLVGKFDPYECGVPLLGSSRERFSVHFYVVAILFILFDLETVFLIPWALASGGNALWFYEMAGFVAVLGFGLLYVWRRGVLEWE